MDNPSGPLKCVSPKPGCGRFGKLPPMALFFIPILLPFLLSAFNSFDTTVLFNMSYTEGMANDFSNVVVELLTPTGGFVPDYSIDAMEAGEWALLNVSVPEDSDYSISISIFEPLIPEANETEEANETAPSLFENDTGAYQEISELPLNETAGLELLINETAGGFLNETVNETLDITLNETINVTVNGTANETALQLPDFYVLSTIGEYVTVSKGLGRMPVDVSSDVYARLMNNETVRVIVKYKSVPEEQQFGSAWIADIPSRKLLVMNVNYTDFIWLVNEEVVRIYPDTPMSAALGETIPLIGADLVHDNLSVTGSGTGVCLLDTGADYGASQFEGTVVNGYDFVNDDADAMDDNGHGSFMASVIHEVAPGATILSVKVLDGTGVGYSSDIIEGIEYCRENAANYSLKTISMSFGGGQYDAYCNADPVAEAANDAYLDGLFIVASAGNGLGSYVTAPACAGHAVGVSSTTKSDSVSSFSNMNGMVDLLAPGESVTAEGLGGSETRSGTSISAAHVSAASALLFGNESLSQDAAEERFKTTGVLIEYGGANYSRINVYNAIMNITTGMPTNTTVNETNETGNYTYNVSVDVSACPYVINASGTYNLINNVSSNGTCITINASGVVLNCSGYTIAGNGSGSSSGYGVDLTGSGDNSIVRNCRIVSFYYGIDAMNGASNNTFMNNIVYNPAKSANGRYGMYLVYSNLYTVENNTIYNMNDHGMRVYGGGNNVIANNTIYNTTRGIYIWYSNPISLTNNHFYGNTYDLDVVTSATPFVLNMTNATLDNAAGNFQNYTRISINDSVDANTEYTITWTASSTALPAGRFSFREKYVNITTVSGTVSIDSITWHWLDSEVSGIYDDSKFELWKWNATSNWTLMNNTPDTTNYILALTNMNPASMYGILQISNQPPQVGNITLNSTYGTNYTTENLTVYYDTYDLDNTSIKNITNWYVNGSTISVLNMPFEANNGSESSIAKDYSNLSNDGTVYGGATWSSTSGYDGWGAYDFAAAGDYINVSDDASLDFTDSTPFTIVFWVRWEGTPAGTWPGIISKGYGNYDNNYYVGTWSDTREIYFTHNDGLGNWDDVLSGLSIKDSNWSFVAVTVDGNDTGFFIDGATSSGAKTGPLLINGYPLFIGWSGNVAEQVFNGKIDEVRIYNRSLTVDQIQAIYNNMTDRIVHNETEVGDVWQACVTPNDRTEDGLEGCSNTLTIRQPVCKNITTAGEVHVLSDDATTAGTCINISADNVTVDCAGHTITGDGGSGDYGIYLKNVKNATVKNCIIRTFDVGLVASSVNLSNFSNNTVHGNSLYGIYIDPSYNNTIIENNIYNNSIDGLYLSASHNNTIRNNRAYNNSGNGFYLSSSTSNIFINNTADNNWQNGIALASSSTGNSFTNNTVYSNSWSGFNIDSQSNTFENNNAYANTLHGFYILNANNNLTNNSANKNLQYGVYIKDASADNTLLVNATFYGNRYDFYADNGGAVAVTYRMVTSTFRRPDGELQNYTVLSINDSIAGSEKYSINWTGTPGSSPSANHTAFRNKFIRISNQSASVTIDSVVWSWTDAEASGYYEDFFELWKLNKTGWSKVSVTLDTAANTLSVASLNPASDYGIFENSTDIVSVNSCSVLNESKYYIMSTNVTGAPNNVAGVTDITTACMVIASSGATLDCAGYNITNDGTTDAAGVVINGSGTVDYAGVLIKNCPAISRYKMGVYIYYSSGDAVDNVTAFNSSSYGFYVYGDGSHNLSNSIAYNASNGFYVYQSDYNVLGSNTAYNNSDTGFYAFDDADYNNFTNNTAYQNSQHGFYVDGEVSASEYNRFVNNTARNNTNGFVLNQVSNNVFENNDAYNNSGYGFDVDTLGLISSSNNDFTYNRVYSNTLFGFYFGAAQTNDLMNNTVYGSQYGIYLNGSGAANNGLIGGDVVHDNNYGIYVNYATGLDVNYTRFYDNGLDLVVNNTGGMGIVFNMTEADFTNPSGTLENYTRLSVHDAVPSGGAFWVNWTSDPGGAPLPSFRQKFVEMEKVGNFGLDRAVWYWTSAESSGYYESLFSIYETTDGGLSWSPKNATVDTSANTLTILNLAPASEYGILYNTSGIVNVSSCQAINSPGIYVLNQSLTGAPINASDVTGLNYTCIKIAADNVILDCEGYNLTDTGGATPLPHSGIVINGSAVVTYYNTTIQNCRILNYTFGVYLHGSQLGTLENVMSHNNTKHGFYLYGSSNNTITNCTAYNNTENGFYLDNGNLINKNSRYNNLVSDVAYRNLQNGFSIYNSVNNTINGGNSENNTRYGVLLNGTSEDTDVISIDAKNNSLAGILVQDSDRVLISQVNASSNGNNGIYIYSSDACQVVGSTANSNGQSGIRADYSNTAVITTTSIGTIRRTVTAYNGWDGILVYSSNDTGIRGIYSYNNSLMGVRLWITNGSTVSSNTVDSTIYYGAICDNLRTGITLWSADNSMVYGNDVHDNGLENKSAYKEMSVDGTSDSNLIYNNIFNRTAGTNVTEDTGGTFNYWNATYSCTAANIIGGSCRGGNFYSNYNGVDLNHDGIGDTEIPYVISGSSGDNDYLPLTNNYSAVYVSSCFVANVSNANYVLTANLVGNLSSTYGSACIYVNATNATINCEGYNITGNATGSTKGILVYRSNYTSIYDCNVRNYSSGYDLESAISSHLQNDSASDSGNGFYIEGYISGVGTSYYSMYNVIDSSRSWNNSVGIRIKNAEQNNITGTRIWNNSQYGVYTYTEAPGQCGDIQYNYILDHTNISDNGLDGVYLYNDVCYFGINDSRVYDNHRDGVRINENSIGNLIWYSEIKNNTDKGVYVLGNSTVNVAVCNIYNNTDGVYAQDASRYSVLKDLYVGESNISNNSRYGIYAENMPYTGLWRNREYNNQHGVYIYNTTPISGVAPRVVEDQAYNNTLDGFILSYTDGAFFNNCSSYNNNETGFHLIGSYYNVINNSNSYNNTLYGFHLFRSANYNNFTYSNAYNNTQYGVFLDDGPDNNNFRNCVFGDNSQIGIMMDGGCADNYFNSVTVSNNGGAAGGTRAGIWQAGGSGTTFDSCTVKNNTGDNARFIGTTGAAIQNNVFEDNGATILLQSCSGWLLQNNIFNRTVAGTPVYDNATAGENDWNGSYSCLFPNIIGGTCHGGNYYSDYNGTDVTSPPDGIGDTEIPYVIYGGGSLDHLPLTNKNTIDKCFYANTSNGVYNISADLIGNKSDGYCITVIADNVTVLCNHHGITGNEPTGIGGVHHQGTGTSRLVISNCEILNYTYGYHAEQTGIDAGLTSDNLSVVVGFTVHNVSTGFFIESSRYIGFAYNNVYDVEFGFYAFSGGGAPRTRDIDMARNNVTNASVGFSAFYNVNDTIIRQSNAVDCTVGYYIPGLITNGGITISDSNATGGYYGVSVLSSNGTNISSVLVSNTSSAAIALNDTYYTIIENSIVQSTPDYGFYVAYSRDANLTNNTAKYTDYGFYLEASSNNTLRGNTAYNNTAGFFLNASSNGNVLSGNFAYNNSENGVYLRSSSGTTLVNNTAYGHLGGGHGFYLYSAANTVAINNTAHTNTYGFMLEAGANSTTLANNTAHDNNGQGLLIYNSNNTNATHTHLYNNGQDFYIRSDSIARTVYLYNLTVDNAADNFQNYTSLNITDSVEANTAYIIDWTTNSSALPEKRFSFRQKFVEIVNLTGSVSIDSITWTWLDDEAVDYREQYFELWKYNATGGWEMLNNTPDTAANTLGLTNMNPASDYGILQYDATECMVINASGSYSLNNNLAGAPINASDVSFISWACIKIATSNVTLDCNGYNITNNGTADAVAIVVNGSGTVDHTNVTIRNCPRLSGYEYGAYIYSSSQDTIQNVTSRDNEISGFFLYSASSYNTIANSTAYNNSYYGFYVAQSTYNNLTSNIAYNNSENGFVLQTTAAYNILTNNTAYGNLQHGFYLLSYADNNTLRNNTAYWNAQRGFYLQLSSYNRLENNNASHNSGYSFYLNGSSDYNNLTNSIAYNNTGAMRVELSNNNRLENNYVERSGVSAIFVTYSNYTTLINNTAHNNSYGIMLYTAANYNNLTNNTARYNTYQGFWLQASDSNRLAGNTAHNNSEGFYVNASSANILANNTAYSNSQYGIDIYISNNTNISNTHLYSNGKDFYISNTGTAKTVYLYNLTIDNAAGNFTNYTSLNISDSVEVDTGYMIDWTTNSSALPANRISFAQKFVDISNTTGTVSIDSITWTWLDSEAAGYIEAWFELWKYNATNNWTLLNSTPNTAANTLGLTNMNPASIYGILQAEECDSCWRCDEMVDASNSYVRVAANIFNYTSHCIGDVKGVNVTLDCQGYNMNGTVNTSRYAVYVRNSTVPQTNFTLKNCDITNWGRGVHLQDQNNTRIENTTINCGSTAAGYYGMVLWNNTKYSSISDVHVRNCQHGIVLTSYNSPADKRTSYNNISNSSFTYNGYGLFIGDSITYNLFNNVSFSNNTYGVYSPTSDTTFCSGNCNDDSYNEFRRCQMLNNSWYGFYSYNYAPMNLNIINMSNISENGREGIRIDYQFNNFTLVGNDISNNCRADSTRPAIFIDNAGTDYGNGLYLKDNVVYNPVCRYGFYLNGADGRTADMTMINNTFNKSSYAFYLGFSSTYIAKSYVDWNITSDNFVDVDAGVKRICWYVDNRTGDGVYTSATAAPADCGVVGIINTTGLLAENITTSNVSHGVLMVRSYNNTVRHWNTTAINKMVHIGGSSASSLEGSDDNLFQNMTVRNLRGAQPGGSDDSSGVYARTRDSDNNQFLALRISDSELPGIDFYSITDYSNKNTIANSIINNSLEDGMQIAQYVEGFNVTNNTILSVGDVGIYFASSYAGNHSVIGNNVTDGGIFMHGASDTDYINKATVAHNTITGYYNTGLIYTNYVRNSNFSNNTLYYLGGGPDGFTIYRTRNSTFEYNRISLGSGGEGFYLGATDYNITISGNNMSGAASGIRFYGGATTARVLDTYIYNNSIFNTQRGIYGYYNADRATFIDNWMENCSIAGIHLASIGACTTNFIFVNMRIVQTNNNYANNSCGATAPLNFTNLTLERWNGSIVNFYDGPFMMTNHSLAFNTNISTNFVSINVSSVPEFNRSAYVTTYTDACPTKVMKKYGFPSSRADILANGSVYSPQEVNWCTGSWANFNVTDFSGYALTGLKGCQIINASGEYELEMDAVGAPYDASPLSDYVCVKIAASNVDFSCAGYNITDNTTGGVITYGVLLNGSLNNVTVRDCPGITDYYYAIYSYQSDNVTVINNTVWNNTYGGIWLDNTSYSSVRDNLAYDNDIGFMVDAESAYVNVTNNTEYGGGTAGFAVEDYSSYNLLSNNTAHSNAQRGFLFQDASNNTITACLAYNNSLDGFYVSGTNTGNNITNNTAYENADGFSISSTASYLTNNSAYNNTDDGISIASSDNIIIANNLVFNNSDDGMYFSASSYCVVENNTIYNGHTDGIYLITSNRNNFTNNTVRLASDDGIEIQSTSAFNRFVSNTVYNNSDAGIHADGENTTLLGNSVYNNTGNGITVVTGANFVIAGNNVSNNNAYGMLLNTISVSTVENNTVYGQASPSSGFGVVLFGSSTTNVTSNVVYNNALGGIASGVSSNNNRIVNNTVYDHASAAYGGIGHFYHPLYGAPGTGNLWENNTAYNNSYNFYFYRYTGTNTLRNNTGSNSVNDCFYISGANGTILLDNTASNSSRYGLYLLDSTNVTANYTTFYNNRYDLVANNTGGTALIFNMTNSTFKNPIGTLENYTILSIHDSIEASTAYSVNWTTNSTALPADRFSFREKYVNISAQAGTVSIDSVTWHWLDSEISGIYDESRLELWKWNGTWAVLNSTPDVSANTLGLTNMNPASDYGILQNNLTGCQVINESGDYALEKNAVGAPYDASPLLDYVCVKITVSNVLFDCAGYNITDNGTSASFTTYGVLLNGSLNNVTVQNCPAVSNYTYGVYIYQSENSTVTNSTANNNTEDGFHLGSSSNITISDSAAYNNTNYGFYITGWPTSTNNTLVNNIAHDNLQDGFFVQSADYNLLINNTAYANAFNGFYFSASSGNNLSDSISRDNGQYGLRAHTGSLTGSNIHLYNNTGYEMLISGPGAVGPITVNITNATIDNPQGDFQNYTSINLNDLDTASGSGYYIKWNPEPATPPSDYFSFVQKYINITKSGPFDPAIDQMQFTWLTPEVVSPYNESRFELWKHNGTWSYVSGQSLSTAGNYIEILNLNPSSTYGILQNNVTPSNCMIINSSGSYQLSGDAIGAPYEASPLNDYVCIKIAASNVLFDCAGYTITDNGTAATNHTYGILLNGSLTNVTVRNCAGVSNYTNGIYSYYSNSSLFVNNTVHDTYEEAFFIRFSNNNNLTDNVAYGTYGTANGSATGFHLSNSLNNTLANNVAHSHNLTGFSTTSSSNNTFLNNIAYNNSAYGFLLGTSSLNNTLRNNTAYNHSSYGFYVLSNSNSNNLTDNVAYNNNNAGFMISLSSNNTLSNNRAYDNNVSGFEVYWPTSRNNTLINNTAYNSTYGFYLYSSPASIADANTAYNASSGFYVYDSSDNALRNNIVYNSTYGFNIQLTSDRNNLTNNTAYNNTQHGFYLSSGTNTSFVSNTAYNNTVHGFYVSGNYPVLNNNTAYINTQHGFYVLAASTRLDNNTAYNNTLSGFYINSNTNNLTGNKAYNNTQHGFQIPGSSNIFIDDVGYQNLNTSFFVRVASANVFVNCTANGSARHGFYLLYSSDTNLSNCSAYDNTVFGIYISSSNNTNATNTHLYNNFNGSLYVEMDSTARVLDFNNLTIDNAAGNFENYTSLSITDTVTGNSAYKINWTANSTALPADRFSFREKYVNITTVSGTVSIDSITWHWLDSEVTGDYDDSRFELWKYNSSNWTLMNDSPDITANTLGLTNHVPGSDYGILQYNVSGCQVITSPGSYQLGTNAVGAPNDALPLFNYTCVKIAASNVLFDCAGYNITDNGTADTATTYGILVNGSLSNITIRNCPGVSNYSYGIYLYQSENSSITNSTAFENIGGFVLDQSSRTNITDSISYNNSLYGFYLFNSSSNNQLINDAAYNNTNAGFYLYLDSDSNILTNNSAYDNPGNGGFGYGFHINSGSDYCTLTNNTAHGNAVSGFFIDSASSHNLTDNDAYDDSQYGFQIRNSSSNRIINNTAYNHPQRGFYLIMSSYNIIEDNIARNSTYGFQITYTGTAGSIYNNLTNNTAYENSDYGFVTGYYSDYNRFANNTAYTNQRGFAIVSANNTLIDNEAYNNTIAGFYQFFGFGPGDASADENTYRNNIAYNNTDGASSGYGFYISEASRNTLINNSAYNNSWAGSGGGFTFVGSSYNQVENNTAEDNLNNAFEVTAFFAGSTYNTFVNNSARGNAAYSFYLDWAASDNTFENNTIYNSQSGFVVYGTYNNITTNDIYNQTAYGVYLEQGAATTENRVISNNISLCDIGVGMNATQAETVGSNIINYSRIGIAIYGAQTSNISDNTIHNISEYGMEITPLDVWGFIYYSDYNNITYNSIYDAVTYGIYVHPYFDGVTQYNVTGNQYFYNNISNADRGMYLNTTNDNSITGNNVYDNTYGIYMDPSYNNTVLENDLYNNSQDGLYLEDSHNNTIRNNTAYNNTRAGFYFVNSTQNNLSINNITNNIVMGLYLNGNSNTNALTQNYICFNDRMDLNNSDTTSSGVVDTCDYWYNWTENGHWGCTFACTSLWHRFFGNTSGTLYLTDNVSGNGSYMYRWENATGFNVYFADIDSVIQWDQLQAISRNITDDPSTNDFFELDNAFSSGSYADNISITYSTDGSTPRATEAYVIYGRTVNNVPVANSSVDPTVFKTGIFWDMSDGGTQYSNAYNQSTVWAVKVNSSAGPDKYGYYHYLGMIPYTLADYEGATSAVAIYLEVQ